MSWALAIDQSTSSTKAIAFDEVGRKLDSSSLPHGQIFPQPGWVEHDAEEIWSNFQQVVHDVYQRQRHQGLPDFICLTNQRETFVVFDGMTGKPMHHAIVWQCSRGEAICRQIANTEKAFQVAEKTGLKIDTYFSASKLTWLVENVPEIAMKLASGEAVFGTMDTYLIHRLTNGAEFATDFTNASRTLLFDINRLQWDPILCELFRLPTMTLAEVHESSDCFGETTVAGILPKPVRICGVVGDSQAALFAQHCFKPGSVKATFGTGTSVMVNVGQKFVPPSEGTVTALAWVVDEEPTYACEGLINFSAATIAWLQEKLELIDSVSETESLAHSVADSAGVYLVPAFAGLGAPYWKAEARAAIIGMTAHSTRAHVVRAGLESIAYQLNDVLQMLQQSLNFTLECIQADGGATCNQFLMQSIADICDVQLEVASVAELSAKGAWELGWLGANPGRSRIDLATLEKANPISMSRFAPLMDPKQRLQQIKGWRDAVHRVL